MLREPLFSTNDIIVPVGLKLKGEFLVIASVPAGTVEGEDGYNIILNHRGPFKVYPRDEKKWTRR